MKKIKIGFILTLLSIATVITHAMERPKKRPSTQKKLTSTRVQSLASCSDHVLVKTVDGGFLLNKKLLDETFKVLLTHGSKVPCTTQQLEALLRDLSSEKVTRTNIPELIILANLAHYFKFAQLQSKYITLLASRITSKNYEKHAFILNDTLPAILNNKIASAIIFKNSHVINKILSFKSETLTGHSAWITCLSFSPDGNRLATGSWDKTVKLWDGKTGSHIENLTGHTDYINCLSFSPDGNRLATGSYDETVKLWDSKNGQLIATPGHTHNITCLSFSPDGNRLATGSGDQTVKLWDGKTGSHIANLTGHSDWIKCLSFSPDGNRLATGSCDKTVKLWDGKTGQLIATLTGHTDYINCLSFSPDGNRLATGSGDQTVKLWDSKNGQLIATPGHTHWITCLSFSPDGNRLATGSWDKTVKLWDGKTGQFIKTLTGHTNNITCLSFSPDGNRLATGSGDQTVKLWDFSLINYLQNELYIGQVMALLALYEIPELTDEHPSYIVNAFKTIDQHKEILKSFQKEDRFE